MQAKVSTNVCVNVCMCVHVHPAHTFMCVVPPLPVAGKAWLVHEQASQRVSNPRRKFPWQTYWFYGFPPKVVIMIHHGRIWQDRLLGEEVAKQFAAIKTKGGLWLLIPPNETKEGEIYPSISPSIPLSLSPWVSCFPVCRYGCMNLLQMDLAKWIGFAALLRIRGAEASQTLLCLACEQEG